MIRIKKSKVKKLPKIKQNITHEFTVEKGTYNITVGLYKDETPGEISVTTKSVDLTIAKSINFFCNVISLALQNGTSIKTCIKKLYIELLGKDERLPITQSITNYILEWLGQKFLNEEELKEIGIQAPATST
ncbi:MAG: hypothetical protein AAB657_05035 [Patescibacteria group bacterium]